MATSKPRITISLDPEAYQALKELATAQDRPMSSVVSEYLEMASPVFTRIAATLKEAKALSAQADEKKSAANAGMLASLEQGQASAEEVLTKLFEVVRMGAESAAQPPDSNHGGQKISKSPSKPYPSTVSGNITILSNRGVNA